MGGEKNIEVKVGGQRAARTWEGNKTPRELTCRLALKIHTDGKLALRKPVITVTVEVVLVVVMVVERVAHGREGGGGVG